MNQCLPVHIISLNFFLGGGGGWGAQLHRVVAVRSEIENNVPLLSKYGLS